MNSIGILVRGTRRAVGMSQVELAVESGLSLATVQNIEADRANPSLSTLRGVLEPLGLTLTVEPEEADWYALAALGLPLAGSTTPGPRDPASLRRLIQRAALEIDRHPEAADAERKREALQALLLAIRRHFPTRFRSWFRRSSLILGLVPSEPTGRIVKLSRIALAPLAEIL